MSKLLSFFVPYLRELAAGSNKQTKYVTLVLDIKNFFCMLNKCLALFFTRQ